MGVIHVKGIKVYAYHGCLEEEAKIGGHYIINVSADAPLEVSEESDDLNDTLDYGRITEIVIQEMGIRSKLIENVAKRIIQHLQREWNGVIWKVKVIKLRPPINGNVSEVSYTAFG